jgi:hypothetical protein
LHSFCSTTVVLNLENKIKTKYHNYAKYTFFSITGAVHKMMKRSEAMLAGS